MNAQSIDELYLDQLAAGHGESYASARAALSLQLGALPTAATLMCVQRWLDAAPARLGPTVRIETLIVADATLQPMTSSLRVFGAVQGLELAISVAQNYTWPAALAALRAEVEAGERPNPQAVIAFFDFEKLLPEPFVSLTDELMASLEDTLRSRLKGLLHLSPRSHVMVCELTPIISDPSAVFPHTNRTSRRALVQAANTRLRQIADECGIEVCAVTEWLGSSGRDVGRYLHADTPFSTAGEITIARMMARQIAARAVPRRKVLVLDLDNTMWRGVIGEEGEEGIIYRPDTPDGRAFALAQRWFLAQAQSGVLLALCSKNNSSDVEPMFSREDFPFQKDSFAAMRINWLPKPDNIRAMADELSLGLDSFVFMDDSDMECAAVRAALPEVMVVQVPARSSRYMQVLANISVFDKAFITDADRERAVDYTRQAKRRELREAVGDEQAFLHSLEIEIAVGYPAPAQLDRVVQLFERTNQFNMSGRRTSRAELDLKLSQEGAHLFTVGYRDRFGDSGTVGALLCIHDRGRLVVEEFVLSCRVLGRGVEHAVIGELMGRFACPTVLDAHPTKKNAPAMAFAKALASNGEGVISQPRATHARVLVVA